MSDVDAVLARVLADLAPDRAERRAVGRTRVAVGGRRFELCVATRGRLLLRITETTFVVPGPEWDVDVRGPVSLRVGHHGMVRPTGTRVAVRAGDEAAHALAGRLRDSTSLAAATLPLDFTDFAIAQQAGRLEARLVLMGGSMTRFRIPPTSSYTRLHDDQRTALLATIAALDDNW